MKPLVAFGLATIAGVIVFGSLPRTVRGRLTAGMKDRMLRHMEHVMESLPEGAPPKLVMSVLPRLQTQNEQIIALLQELKELIRAQERTAR
jgi:hypothetical protein